MMARTEGRFYADGTLVRKESTVTQNDDGSSSMSLDFPICTAHEAIGEDGAKSIAAHLNACLGMSYPEAAVKAMREALEKIANLPEPEDEWDAAEKYDEAQFIARAALAMWEKNDG